MLHIDLPYDIGTVSAYTVFNKGYSIWISGYKEPCSGEYSPEEVIPMTEEEIIKLKIERG